MSCGVEMEAETAGEDMRLSLPDALLLRYDYKVEERVCRIVCPESPTGKKLGNGMIIPREIALDGYDVTHAGDATKVRELCSHVKELHLPSNRLTQWHDVHTILNNMPFLQFLNLTCNNLNGEGSSASMNTLRNIQFDSLRKLILNGTNTSWSMLNQMLTHHLPNIEHIHLSMNGYSKVELSSELQCLSMHSIHFNGNPVSEWREVCKLGQAFPNLHTLVMEDSHISSVDPNGNLPQPAAGSAGKDQDELDRLDNGVVFAKLQSLNIAGCKLSSWEEFDKLHTFPSIICFRVRRTPLVQEYSPNLARQLCIARLPNVEKLNGSEITQNERQDAERALLRQYLETPDNRPGIYTTLEEKHGKLDPLAEVNMSPKTNINVRIVYREQITDRVIDLYQTVQQLKQGLKDLVGLPVSKMMLYYVDVEFIQCMGPEEMKYNNKKLYTYGIHENDHILVDKRI